MRLAYLLPGSGGSFYCENCSRDLLVTSALREAGCELHTVPLYLPLYGLGPEIGDHPVFFGGVMRWVRVHLPPLRHAPRWLDELLDSDLLLRLAASRAGSTSARDLGPMTNSMLLGDRGPHRGEAHRLAAWLADLRPDVVHLSNALLLGLAPAIKERTGAAIVCSLQDEAEWVEAMAGAWPETVWRTMAEQAGAVDAFVAVSRPYAERVAPRLGLDPRRIGVLPLGVARPSRHRHDRHHQHRQPAQSLWSPTRTTVFPTATKAKAPAAPPVFGRPREQGCSRGRPNVPSARGVEAEGGPRCRPPGPTP